MGINSGWGAEGLGDCSVEGYGGFRAVPEGDGDRRLKGYKQMTSNKKRKG